VKSFERWAVVLECVKNVPGTYSGKATATVVEEFGRWVENSAR
jgi:hypothetical protein